MMTSSLLLSLWNRPIVVRSNTAYKNSRSNLVIDNFLFFWCSCFHIKLFQVHIFLISILWQRQPLCRLFLLQRGSLPMSCRGIFLNTNVMNSDFQLFQLLIKEYTSKNLTSTSAEISFYLKLCIFILVKFVSLICNLPLPKAFPITL